MSISSNGHLQDEDSDIESDFTAAEESDYYQPINGSISEPESDSEEPESANSNGIANGNGILHINLNSSESESELELELESEEKQDESVNERRELELSSETSKRIMDVMRGIEFRGAAPPWAEQVPEEQWLEQLQRIRGEGGETSSIPPS